MKKIINGKMYNTETAKFLGSYHGGGNQRNFNYFEENLYIKKTGEYFIEGWGNANSKYREYYDDNNWGGGEEIIPLTEAEAEEWVMKHLTADEFEEIFGEVEE